MSILLNMKIRTKLFSGFALLLAVLAFVATYAALQITSVDNSYSYVFDYPVERRSLLRDIEVAMMDARRIMNRASMSASEVAGDGRDVSANVTLRNQTVQAQENLIAERRQDLQRFFDAYRQSLWNDTVILPSERDTQLRFLDSLEHDAFHYIDYYINRTMAYARTGNATAAIIVTRDYAINTVNSFYDTFGQLRDSIETRMLVINQELTDTTVSTRTLLIVLAVIGFILGLGAALLISSAITKPVGSLMTLVRDVSGGNLNVNMNRANVPADEIGTLTMDMYNLVDTISGINVGLGKFYDELSKGNQSYLMDEKGFDGAYLEMVAQMNSLMKNFISNRGDILTYFRKVADGDFNAKCAHTFVGDETYINNIMEEVKGQIADVVSAITDVAKHAQSGDVKYSVDSAKYKGEWANIIIMMNNILEAINKPISETKNVLERFNHGYFDKTIDGNYTGIFQEIKNDVNMLIKGMGEYVREIDLRLGNISNGDLTSRTSMKFDGDFDAIGKSINKIAETLHKTMSEISSASEQVLSGAKQISVSAIDLANGATEQASSVQELNASINLINQQTKKNSDNAIEANTLSSKSTENAKEGNNAMKEMLEAMTKVKDSSNNISRVIKLIQDIAFQTNLLALNAAVEAARAGEHGKGFSVVAEEVRTLAARSQQAVEETTEMIKDSIDHVDAGSSIAESTADALNLIVQNADEVLQIINNISDSSREQADSIGQVNVGIGQISAVVQSNSAVSEETAAAAEELNSQAELLKQLISYFKL